MRPFVVASVFWLAAATGCVAACSVPQDAQQQVILRFDVTDMGAMGDVPLLTLRADGHVAVPLRGEIREGRLPETEVQDLLDAMVSDGVLDLTTEQIADALAPQSTGGGQVALPGLIADGATSYISLDMPGCRVSLSAPDSALNSLAHPDAAPLQAFRRSELRLLDIVMRLQRG
ncbi:hypothetical protein [Tropicibacter sp. S64]|uniref:hypothetical protein n=1 Tax=Tropicibacter sp. S64 TaxID=3415122 RepID=UPI003C7B345F